MLELLLCCAILDRLLFGFVLIQYLSDPKKMSTNTEETAGLSMQAAFYLSCGLLRVINLLNITNKLQVSTKHKTKLMIMPLSPVKSNTPSLPQGIGYTC